MDKKIPIKNYVILSLIVIFTLIAVVYIFAWYKQYEDSKVVKPVITNTIREVEYNNLSTVVRERDILIMYMCTTTESVCRSFEKKFSTYIKENNLSDNVIYLNLGYDSDENGLLDKVYNKYKTDTLVKKISSYPTIVVFSDGKIVDALSSSKKDKITIEKLEEFLKSYELDL